ncbi:MAG: DUF4272 domain-containing protein [Sandaracinus sp.]|nr:DUF4272 domain-containing protein [Myxococcales bacterium]MCB9601686.1 DUF4272 domain-containing protein [Sandaracinus sp.]MCB9636035.1 DUF4272 domain-containing protein [Sandaracinus sp.]
MSSTAPRSLPQPPSPERVFRRAQVLLAVATRAMVELVPERHLELPRLRSWLTRRRLWPEAEASEVAVLTTDGGGLDARSTIDGTWRAEGVAVLAWALDLAPLPALEGPVDPSPYGARLELLSGARTTPRALRPLAERERYLGAAYAMHWRVCEAFADPFPMDFAERLGSIGVDLTLVPLVDGDLAVQGVPIGWLRRDRLRTVASIAKERHQAAAWLCGCTARYDEVPEA